jgi:hypothetical protein
MKSKAKLKEEKINKRLDSMTFKSKSWTKYSKDMAASIIQTRWKKYLAKKNGDDLQSVYSENQNPDNSRLGYTTGKPQAQKSAFYQADTARTDRVLLDVDVKDVDSKDSTKHGPKLSEGDLGSDDDGDIRNNKSILQRNI